MDTVISTFETPLSRRTGNVQYRFKNKYNAIYKENVSFYATSSNTETLLYKTIIMHQSSVISFEVFSDAEFSSVSVALTEGPPTLQYKGIILNPFLSYSN